MRLAVPTYHSYWFHRAYPFPSVPRRTEPVPGFYPEDDDWCLEYRGVGLLATPRSHVVQLKLGRGPPWARPSD